MLKAMKSVFLCILLMKTIAWKLSLWKPNSFIVLCMHALSLNSKCLIERNIFPAFLTTQVDQSSPADFVLHRQWKAPIKGFKTSLILISRVTGVLPWKKDKALYDNQLFIPCKFPCICWMKRCSCYDISTSERQNYLLHLLSLKFRVV